MTPLEVITSPVLECALVLGVLGGAGLALTAIYSRRGPSILPVYAALLADVAVLLAKHPGLSFEARVATALSAFLIASAMLYVVASVLATEQRRRLVAEGRLNTLHAHLSPWGHLWRLGLLAVVGGVCSAIAVISC